MPTHAAVSLRALPMARRGTSFATMRGIALFLALVWIAPVLVPSMADAAGKDTVMGPVEAKTSAESGEIVLIDIRHPSEWRETGVAAPAKTITMHDPKGPNAFLNAVVKAVGGDISRPVALICASGVRSTTDRRSGE